MAELKGSKTEKNLMEAFAGESQARNRYGYFAAKAKQEGYDEIAAILEETARNEMEHAKVWYMLLCGGSIPDTVTNLKAAIAGEHQEWTEMYKRMEADAQAEGFNSIQIMFDRVSNIEKRHEERLQKLLESIVNKGDAPKAERKIWICRDCGHTVEGESAPAICPVCGKPHDHFELRTVNY